MKPALKSAAALAPILLALAACGGGAEEASEPAAEATTAAIETAAPADAATPAPDATPTPDATPSESPSPTPTPTAAVPAPAVAAASKPAVFNQCAACHSTDRGENGIGPSLAGVFGRRAGTLAGFEYSQAMKDAGLTWNQANLDRYLENPRGVVPGTTMAYNGVKDAAQRQAVINYLKTL
jgi:cytochrome c